jgi:hypothetical protein
MFAQASHSVVIEGRLSQSFARLLLRQGHPIAAIQEQCGEKFFLAICCKSRADARRRTDDIRLAIALAVYVANDNDTTLAHLDLGQWKARRVGRYLLLFWPSIEVRLLH